MMGTSGFACVLLQRLSDISLTFANEVEEIYLGHTGFIHTGLMLYPAAIPLFNAAPSDTFEIALDVAVPEGDLIDPVQHYRKMLSPRVPGILRRNTGTCDNFILTEHQHHS